MIITTVNWSFEPSQPQKIIVIRAEYIYYSYYYWGGGEEKKEKKEKKKSNKIIRKKVAAVVAEIRNDDQKKTSKTDVNAKCVLRHMPKFLCGTSWKPFLLIGGYTSKVRLEEAETKQDIDRHTALQGPSTSPRACPCCRARWPESHSSRKDLQRGTGPPPSLSQDRPLKGATTHWA